MEDSVGEAISTATLEASVDGVVSLDVAKGASSAKLIIRPALPSCLWRGGVSGTKDEAADPGLGTSNSALA